MLLVALTGICCGYHAAGRVGLGVVVLLLAAVLLPGVGDSYAAVDALYPPAA